MLRSHASVVHVLQDLTAPHFAFENAGADLTLASPQRGQPPVSPKSHLTDSLEEKIARLQGLVAYLLKKNEELRQSIADTAHL